MSLQIHFLALFDQNRAKPNFTAFHDGVPLERRQRRNSLLQSLIANMSVLRTNSLRIVADQLHNVCVGHSRLFH